MRLFFASSLFLLGTAFGQQRDSAVYVPGDLVRVTVTLAEPAKARVECSFSRTTEYKPDYSGPAVTTALNGYSTEGNSFPQSSQSEYVISMKVPESLVSGTYRLDSITITIPTADPSNLTGQSKTYLGADVGNLIIEVRNPPPHFPAIKDVTVAPNKTGGQNNNSQSTAPTPNNQR